MIRFILLTSYFILSQASSAVYLTDGAAVEPQNCGGLTSFRMAPDGEVTVVTSGTCGAAAVTTPILAPHAIQLREGETATVHLLSGAAARVPILGASVASPGAGNGSAAVSNANLFDPVLTYTAPPLGSLAQSQAFVLPYTVQEAGGRSAQGRVRVALLASGSSSGPPPATTLTCVNTSTVECRILTWGLRSSQQIAAGKVHVWEFVYQGGQHQIAWADGGAKSASIGTVPGQVDAGGSCAKSNAAGGVIPINQAGQAGAGVCSLRVGQRYFFNLRAAKGDGYALLTY